MELTFSNSPGMETSVNFYNLCNMQKLFTIFTIYLFPEKVLSEVNFPEWYLVEIQG